MIMTGMRVLKNAFAKLSRKPAQTNLTVTDSSAVRKMNTRHSSDFYEPKPQPLYVFGGGLWCPSTANEDSTIISTPLPPIKILTWNIDFMAPLPDARVITALSHLHRLIVSLRSKPPCVILLQEMTASDLAIIQTNPWIRNSFYLTDLDSTNWLSGYGTLTLVDRRLPLTSAFRVRYASRMGRDALFVDIEDRKTSTILRVCNTHLESLVAEPPRRPGQVKLASRYMTTATCGVLAGDFNAIQDFDLSLHVENGLRDTYLEEGKDEAAEERWTWGMQSMYDIGKVYGCKRMDKILFCGKMEVRSLERFGLGVQTEEAEQVPSLYVTDHLGLMADVIITEEQ